MTKYESRLYQEWKQHGKIIIAVDFDDTISPWKFKDTEDLQQLDKTIQLLRVAQETGAYVVIFTACNPDRYDEIKSYCSSKKLTIDSINNTPLDLPYGNHGKVYANIFLDDRAGLLESMSILEKVMYMIRGEQAQKLTLGESI
jgi:hypothetical protein